MDAGGTEEYNSEILSNGLFHSVTKITISRTNDDSNDLDINITNHVSLTRWHTVLIVTGAVVLCSFFLYLFYRLCQIYVRAWVRRRKGQQGRRLSPQEETVNEILSNSGARQVLSSLARTAINSQTNRNTRLSSSQSDTEAGDVMDISERVVRVSFAPSVCSRDRSEEELSVGGESNGPPPYETLSSDQPPMYSDLEEPGTSNNTKQKDRATADDCVNGDSEQNQNKRPRQSS